MVNLLILYDGSQPPQKAEAKTLYHANSKRLVQLYGWMTKNGSGWTGFFILLVYTITQKMVDQEWSYVQAVLILILYALQVHFKAVTNRTFRFEIQ